MLYFDGIRFEDVGRIGKGRKRTYRFVDTTVQTGLTVPTVQTGLTGQQMELDVKGDR